MEPKKKRKTVVITVLALAGLCVFCLVAAAGNLEPSAPPGPTMKTLDEVEPRIPIPGSETPAPKFTISQSGSYYLAAERNCSVTGIQVDVNDVTIDLMGHRLVGPGSGTNYGIFMSERSNVEVRNGTIRDFGHHGLYESSSSIGKNHRVINVRLLSNGSAGIYYYGSGHLVRGCTMADNNGYGVYVTRASLLVNNTIHNNGSDGVFAGSGCSARENVAYSNGSSGINASVGCTVTGNTCYDNPWDGIQTGTGSTIIGNTCYDNDHIGISTGAYCLIAQNAASSNNIGNIDAGTDSVSVDNCAP